MPRKSAPVSLSVLFIGNSFTARNDLPGLVERVATATGAKFNHRLLSIGGASLRTHWNKGEAGGEIQRGGYDFVVLQEQSTLPIKNAGRMHENVRLFAECIKASEAKTALYMTWARRHAPETQDAITAAYTSIGREVGAEVIPAGVAWQKFLRTHPRPVLHDRDASHPTLAGSYLAACVVFGTLFRVSPKGLEVEVDGLTKGETTLLQKTAAEVLR
jgi:hypothetical protein